MRSTAIAVAAFFALLTSAQASAQAITEATVKNMLAKIDRAIATKNATEVGPLLSDNVQISITTTVRGKTQVQKMDKAEYMANLRNTLSMATNLVYRRTNEIIVVSGKSATVTADVFESMVMGGQYMSGRTSQTATIDLVNGVPQITKITARGAM